MEAQKNRIVEQAIRDYPALRASYRALKKDRYCWANPTETAALKELPKEDQKRYDAVRRALERIKKDPHGTEILLIVKYTYWERQHTPEQIAETLEVSVPTVEAYRNYFLQFVEMFLQTFDCEGCCHFRNLRGSIKACFYCLDTGHLRSHDPEVAACPYYKGEGSYHGN